MAQGRHITIEQRRAIIETLEATHNASEAARLNAVSVSTAWKVAKEEGVVLQNRGRPPTISAEQRRAIIETLEATHNASEAARHTVVGVETVRIIAKEEGIELGKGRPRLNPSRPVKEQ